MNIFKSGVIAAGLAAAAFTGIALSQDQGTELNRFSHKTNPHNGGAPTAGSLGTILPLITPHGGPVMSAPANIYVIWYGKWNQPTGSDTVVGQQLVTTFLSN